MQLYYKLRNYLIKHYLYSKKSTPINWIKERKKIDAEMKRLIRRGNCKG